ncbi:MAG: sigma-70 family RNA polymerase sigma factor [Lautropia sp.]
MTVAQTFDGPVAGWAPDAAAIGAFTADMRRFARRRIRDAELAEDAVQDALLAALVSFDGFHGHSTLRTWLFGILSHKIQDTFRREVRYVRRPAFEDADDDSDGPNGRGPWAEPAAAPADDPFVRLAATRLLDRLASEVDQLPSSQREVFLRQAIDDEPTGEVCEALGISEANCWVRLHRARKQLSSRLAEHR